MDHGDRLSRSDRRKRTPSLRSWIALGLSVVLLALVIWQARGRGPGSPVRTKAPQPDAYAEWQDLADSAIAATCRSFELSDSLSVDSIPSQWPGVAGLAYRCYGQAWPSELPFVIFAERLHDASVERRLTCDCLESVKNGLLNCTLRHRDFIGARVLLKADRRTRLADREIAIILENMGSYAEDDVLALLNHGVIFSYLARPDIYPSPDIQKLLAKGGISALLRLPAKRDSWVRMLDITQRNVRTNKPKVQAVFNNAMVDIVFQRHPGTRAIWFDMAAGWDSSIVKPILDKARRQSIAYVFAHPIPSKVDSLAYGEGLNIIRLNIDDDLHNKSLSDTRFAILSRVLSPEPVKRLTVSINAANFSAREVVDLKLTLDKIGVKLKPFMKLTESVEKL